VKGARKAASAYLKPYLGDPLGVVIVERLALSPWHVALIAGGVALIVDAISWALVGDEVIRLSGWTDVWAYGVYMYLISPAAIGAYAWISSAPAKVFYGLRESEAIAASEEEFDAFVKGGPGSLQAAYQHPGWSIASLTVVVALAAYYALIYTRGWSPQAAVLRALKVVLVYVPGWYAVCRIVSCHGATIWGLRRLFGRFEVTPHPLHPDHCGGLRAINDYAVGFTYIIALSGIGVSLMSYVTLRRTGALAPDTALWVGVYLALALISFFLPPWTAHAAMLEAKRKLLSDISRRFQSAYAETRASLGVGTGALLQGVERIERLHRLYELTDAFPVWPFDTASLRRFAVTVTVPVAPLLVELAAEGVRFLLSR
jgi:hypothetical protein